MNVAPSATYEAVVDWGSTGATLGLRVIDNAGATAVARLATLITEFPAGSGIYSRTGNVAPSAAGQYTLVWDDDGGTAAIGHVATEELLVTTEATAGVISSGNLYVTATVLKATLSLTGQTFADDDVNAAVSSASRAVDNYCGRRFYQDTDSLQVRYYTASDTWRVVIDDITTITAVAVDLAGQTTYGTTLTNGTNFEPEPYNAAADGWPYTVLRIRDISGSYFPNYRHAVKVTGKFGWPSIPAAVSEATSIQAGRLLKRSREAPFGIAGGGIDVPGMRIARIDPDLCMLLDPYRNVRMIL